ncbi:ABC transporter permease [Streptomyces sp. HNM0575]|uniref:ABC transporter permease n=1 Tax=Streptomyces sp. HNM0575 TaxID=2716338 RepID=UPI00145D6488|nr:ABC transporter permease [Streptomyces sp. HNM0575]NLU75453.1 ABC transporter permease [Streptomyces sp. HNM0575]
MAGAAAKKSGECLTANDWICAEYVRTRGQELTDATVQHVWITLASVLLALIVAFPLALAARRWQRAYGPVLGLTTVLYTVPSLAMYALLLPLFGLGASVVVTGLVLYSLTVLVRNILAGLESVPEEAREAARGMGYGPYRLLFGVELPLALPALMAGVRIATVSAVALTTVGAIVGYGGLGNLIYDGMDSFFRAQVLTASVICVLLAVAADVLLLGLQRLLTPWVRTAHKGGAGGTGGRGGGRLRGRGRGRGRGRTDAGGDGNGDGGGVDGTSGTGSGGPAVTAPPEPAGKGA